MHAYQNENEKGQLKVNNQPSAHWLPKFEALFT